MRLWQQASSISANIPCRRSSASWPTTEYRCGSHNPLGAEASDCVKRLAMHRMTYRIGAIFLPLLLCTCIFSTGCAHMLAARIVQAPNHDAKPEERMDAPQQLLDELYVN